MITLEDCYGFCDLEEETVKAIAEHEHVNEIVAIEITQHLLKQEGGILLLHRMLEDDMEWAQIWGKTELAQKYRTILEKFDERYSSPNL
ncbi:hypothetical protein [Pleionea sediminis]|uniref:hypothetical protein n=1 Tax=Pleionea sediminis TaxID=2569479 RepID=UPI001186EAE0|nr:hypothetical protein [Pleionea sediminis]